MIGDLLNYTVQKFTKKCTSVDDLNNEEKFREMIENVANDFLSNNKDILNQHKNNFIDELNQRGQVDIKQPLPSVDELILGAIGGIAEGFWLNRKQHNNPPTKPT
jgi:6-phosphogluconate dehydrogenase